MAERTTIDERRGTYVKGTRSGTDRSEAGSAWPERRDITFELAETYAALRGL